MQEMPALAKLILVKFTAELKMNNSFPLFLLELLNPLRLVAMNRNVQLLQHAEVSTRRRANQEVRRLLLDLNPRLPPVLLDIEVPTVREIKNDPACNPNLRATLAILSGE